MKLYTARVPTIWALRWTADTEHPSVRAVKNGYDRPYGYVMDEFYSFSSPPGAMLGEEGDYLCRVPGTDNYYFMTPEAFERLFQRTVR